MKKINLVLLALAFSVSLFAEIKMPSIFGDDMLLQRDVSVKIWGKADANATVDVSFAGQKKSTKADAKGNWSLKLEKMSANKNPQEMIIFENGKIGKTIKNILVGEVWIAGGQSNMEWRLYQSSDAKPAMERAKYPMMRYFHQPSSIQKTPQEDSVEKSHWVEGGV
jgi:sialate O-acetylesterase